MRSGEFEREIGVHHAFHCFLLQIPDDENEAGTAVVTRPFLDLGRRMEHMLDGMHDDRLVVIEFLQVQQAFDAQDVGAVGLGHHIQRTGDPVPFQRLVEIQHEGMNVIVMPADIVVVPMVVIMAMIFVVAMPVIVMMHMAFGRPVGFLAQPLADIRTLGFWIIESGIEQDRRRDVTLDGLDDGGRWIELVEPLFNGGNCLGIRDVDLG